MKLNKATILAVIIILSSVILAISSFWNDSLIVDEIPHVGSGYSYVKKLDYRLNPEHPPLAKALAAAPLLFLDLKQNGFQTKFWLENINGQWDFGRFLIFQSGNNAELITRVVKFPMLIFFVLSAVLIYLWTKKLYSSKYENFLLGSDSTLKGFNPAALIALTLFTFSPTVMAHARFVTTDLPALFGVLLATYFFLKFLKNPNRKNLWLSALAFGVAMLTKFSTFLLIPYFLTLAIIYGVTHNNKKTKSAIRYSFYAICVFVIGFALVVWPVYYIFTFNYPPERQLADTQFLLGSFGNRTLAGITEWMADKPVIRSLGQYMLGLLMVTQRSSGGNTTYFLGEVSAAGWRYYFPTVYALKEPLAWFILVIIALLFLAWQVKISNIKYQISKFIKNHFVEFAMLLWMAIYWATSIKSNLNIGVRHLLPTYPFAIILVSGQIAKIWQMAKSEWQMTKNKLKLFAISFMLFALAGWYIFENLRVWPHYLTYFNQFAGGPSRGYLYVVDSNLDWGQDLKRLSQWVGKNNINKIHLDYFGWSDPAYYLGPKFQWLTAGQYKNARDFINQTGGGYLGVSATFLMGSRAEPEKSYAWLQRYEPLIIIGNSIWVWELK